MDTDNVRGFKVIKCADYANQAWSPVPTSLLGTFYCALLGEGVGTRAQSALVVS